jgi:UDP-N-acetylglucosamine--N-acetylmuramyl-(pentapeptide) pyrophosphoryl-undecaprenol N-acetylglucosamine transferase
MEAELVKAAGYEIDFVGISGLRGKGLAGWLLAPLRISRALWQSLGIISKRRPALVLGMGGFVTGPGGVAAWLKRIPLVIHEQNAIAGLTNRLLARIATQVLSAFPQAFAGWASLCGNPVRESIAALPEPGKRLEGRSGPLRLLVLGGSLGAAMFNQTLPRALANLPLEQRPQVRHQSGQRHIGAAEQAYQAAGVEAELMPFIDDMAANYAWADLVLCRAGALTVSELAVAGLASILVPFPHAVDDHQSANASWLAEAGAAIVLPQSRLNIPGLGQLLAEFVEDAAHGRARLLAMAQQARAIGMPQATDQVVKVCLQLAEAEQNGGAV